MQIDTAHETLEDTYSFPKNAQKFIVKLYNIVQDPSSNHIVAWTKD